MTTLFLVWNKIHRNGVHTVPRILRRKPFSDENMPQMRATFNATNLGADTIRVRNPLDRARDFIVEAWPSSYGALGIIILVSALLSFATGRR